MLFAKIVVACLVVPSVGENVGTAGLKPWPAVHTALQRMYLVEDNEEYAKPWWYDWPNRRLRTENHRISGSPNSGSPSLFGVSEYMSIWLNTTLYMYDLVNRTCIYMDFGFPMMSPGWFMTKDSEQLPNIWLSQRTFGARDGTSPFRNCTWRRTDSEAGPFDYFAEAETQVPFRLTAPIASLTVGMRTVVNDFQEMKAVDKHPQNVFDLPKDIKCEDPSASSTAHKTLLRMAAFDVAHARVATTVLPLKKGHDGVLV